MSTASLPLCINNPRKLTSWTWPCERLPLGIAGDYKPSMALLPNGDLLLAALDMGPIGADGRKEENTLLFRSGDGGRTWSERRRLAGVLGREQWLTCTRDGTLFMTSHFIPMDRRNQDGYTYSYLHRSTDGGRSWEAQRVHIEGKERLGAPDSQGTHTSRNLIELADGTLLFGVSICESRAAYLWRSTDGGCTWDHGDPVTIGSYRGEPYDCADGWFSEDWNHVLDNGTILHWHRCGPPSRSYPMGDGRATPMTNDSGDRSILSESTDGGHTWTGLRDFGDYSQFYVRTLPLRDGRVLLTFTQRGLVYPLGLQAIFSYDDGRTWDFDADRVIIEGLTPWGADTGGGFGNTVQLADETLVSCASYRGADDQTYLQIVRWAPPRPRRFTDFVHRVRVSDYQPPAGTLADLSYPSDTQGLGFRDRSFGDFWDVHAEILDAGSPDAVLFFEFEFECAEPMRLAASLAYDGPVKMWLDRELVFHDPAGTNPGSWDKACPTFQAAQGRHELIFALGTNAGRAWGMGVRLERVDLTSEQLFGTAMALLPEIPEG